AEITVFATAYAAALAALVYSLRLLPDRLAGSGPSRWTVIFPAAVFLFILSDGAFAQREYFAAAFSVPMFAVFVRRAQEGAWPSVSDRLIAATLAGFAFAIKPPVFAFPFIMLAAYELVRTRSLAFLFPSMLPAAAAAGVIFTAVSLAAFPAYLDGVTTLMREVYVPIHARTIFAFDNLAFIATMFCLASSFALSIRSKLSTATGLAQVCAAGFLVAYFLQGKYFTYHAQPAALFALIALAIPLYEKIAALAAKPSAKVLDAGLYAAMSLLAACLTTAGFAGKGPLVRDLSWAKGLDHPTALAISPSIAVGFPLAEHINARWVDRIHSQWVAKNTRIALTRSGLSDAARELYQEYYDRDIARTRAVIREKAPELIFQINHPEADWLTEDILADDPTLLDDYETIAEEGFVRVLRRRDVGDKTATGADARSAASASP
ncbi:MAG: hypothetical protein RIE56_06250, partial [Amphiplicatus sp.]